MDDKKTPNDKVKTSQPNAEDSQDTSYQVMKGGNPEIRPDDIGDQKKQAESNKVTQRQE